VALNLSGVGATGPQSSECFAFLGCFETVGW